MSVDLAKLRALAETARARQQQSEQRSTAGRGSWYSITNLADKSEIYIYDEIGGWGIDALTFTAELRALNTPLIDLHISSPGGAVSDGLTIYEAVRQHPARITSYVDGVAASAASFIAQAAEHRIIAATGILLLHDAEGTMINGTAADFNDMAELMNEMSANVAAIYQDRAGGTVEQWRDRMRAGGGMNLGTRYVGAAAVDAGLADEVAAGAPSNRLAAVVDTLAQPTDRLHAAGDNEPTAPELDFDGLRDLLKGVFE